LFALGIAGCGSKRPSTQAFADATKLTTTTSTPPKWTATAGGTPGVAAFVQRANNTSNIAFTFHGGGTSDLAQSMLATLQQLKIPVTVFAIGQWLEQNHGLASQILAGGHELANHTYTHPDFNSLTADQMYTEITKCRDVLIAETGSPGKWFRPSSEDAVPPNLVLQQSDKALYPVVVGFDVDPVDYDDPGASTIVSRVGAKITGGSIVSLHFGHAGTVSAMPDLVSLVKSRNLTPVTVSTLLG
jgi:peptidoglycan/xylan/chitin deacetylase (PgdA/CDA1 family)